MTDCGTFHLYPVASLKLKILTVDDESVAQLYPKLALVPGFGNRVMATEARFSGGKAPLSCAKGVSPIHIRNGERMARQSTEVALDATEDGPGR